MWISLLITAAHGWDGNGNDWSYQEDPVEDTFQLNTTSFTDTTGAEVGAAWELALWVWNVEAGARLYMPNGGVTDDRTYGGGDNDRNVTMQESMHFGSTLAKARYNSIGDEMTDCDIQMYAANLNGDITWSYDPDGAPGDAYDFTHTAIHELGHCLGLSHSGVDGAIMGSTNGRGTGWERRHLQPDDIDGIRALYGEASPELAVTTELVDLGNGDGLGQAGEEFELIVSAENIGDGRAIDVLGVLNGDPVIALEVDIGDLGEVLAGASVGSLADALVFSFSVLPECSSQAEAILDFEVSDAASEPIEGKVALALDCGLDAAAEGDDSEEPLACGCQSGPGPSWIWLLALLALRHRS